MPVDSTQILLALLLFWSHAAWAHPNDDAITHFFREEESGCAQRILDQEILKKQAVVEGFSLEVDAFDGGATLALKRVFVSRSAGVAIARRVLASALLAEFKENETADIFGRPVAVFQTSHLLELTRKKLDQLHDDLWKALHPVTN